MESKDKNRGLPEGEIRNFLSKAGDATTLGDAQRIVDDWISKIGGGYFSPLTNMVLLAEESGELARVVARLYGEQVAKDGDMRKSLSEEMADVLWVLICLANECGVDLTRALRESLEKKMRRDSDRFKTFS